MKLRKFDEVVRKHKWIADRITGWLDLGLVEGLPKNYPRRIAVTKQKLKEIVKEEIEFIAFRPFTSLDLSLCTTPYVSEPERRFAHRSVQFSVIYHIEGEPPCSCEQFIYPEDGHTIKTFIQMLHETEGMEVYIRGKAFIVDYIVREDVLVIEATGKGNIQIQVYECPAGCGLNLVPPLRRQYQDPREAMAHRAYMNNAPLPPIMPGQILSAKA